MHSLSARTYAFHGYFFKWLKHQKDAYTEELTGQSNPEILRLFDNLFRRQTNLFKAERSKMNQSMGNIRVLTVDDCISRYNHLRLYAMDLDAQMEEFVVDAGLPPSIKFIRRFVDLPESDVKHFKDEITFVVNSRFRSATVHSEASDAVISIGREILESMNQQRIVAHETYERNIVDNCHPTHTAYFIQRSWCFKDYFPNNFHQSRHDMEMRVVHLGSALRLQLMTIAWSSHTKYAQELIEESISCLNNIHREIANWAKDYITQLILCDFELLHDIVR